MTDNKTNPGGQPPRDEKGQRTDVPKAPNSRPNLPNPSNDPLHPTQPSGDYDANNPANYKPELGNQDNESEMENAKFEDTKKPGSKD